MKGEFYARMKIIQLSKGKNCIVDDNDYYDLIVYKWGFNGRYASRTKRENGLKKTILMHRQIMAFPGSAQIDHINGDKLDNRRCNLRLASNAENQYNRGKQKNNTSGFKGVRLNRKSNKWCAQLKFNGKFHYLGIFHTPEEAHEKYLQFSREKHGDFHYLKSIQLENKDQ